MTRKKDTGESGNAGEFGKNRRDEASVELTATDTESAASTRLELGRNLRADETFAHLAHRMGMCAVIVEKGRAVYDGDELLRYSAHSALIQIGEAAKDLPKEYGEDRSDSSWRELIRFRDKTAHLYGQIDHMASGAGPVL